LCESGALVERVMAALLAVSERQAEAADAASTETHACLTTWLGLHHALRKVCFDEVAWNGHAAATCLREVREGLQRMSSNTALRQQLTRAGC
jgi:hypothetical protein